ncbi:MmcQ/YjbR family DNA-binding protein [Streptomyces mauvecolor]
MASADDVRRIALSEATEELAWDMPTFRVGGKIFASLGDDASMGVGCPKEGRADRRRARQVLPARGHDGHFGRLRVRLAGLDGARALSAILADSWRQVAPRKIQDAHPAPGG